MAKGVFILFFAMTMALLIGSVYCKMVEEANAHTGHKKGKVHDAVAPMANKAYDAAAPKADHAKRKASHVAGHVKPKASHNAKHGKHKTPDATETAEGKAKTTYDDETGSEPWSLVKFLFGGYGKKKGSGSKGVSYAPAPAPGIQY